MAYLLLFGKAKQGFLEINFFTMRKDISNKGFTLIEMLAVLVILGILGATIAPKVISFDENSRRQILEKAVADLNGSIRTAWAKSLLEDGTGDYTYYTGIIGREITLTEQEPGEEPKEGRIYINNDSVMYSIDWISGTDSNPGHFELGKIKFPKH